MNNKLLIIDDDIKLCQLLMSVDGPATKKLKSL